MKYIIPLASALLLFTTTCFSSAAITTLSTNSANDTLKIVTSPELSGLVGAWVTDFSKTHPSIVFSVAENNSGKSADKRVLSFISGEFQSQGSDENGWKLIVAHDAVVPVINSKNPLLSAIATRGISSSVFTRIITGSGKILWSEIIPGAPQKPVKLYLPENTVVETAVAAFTHSDLKNTNIILTAGNNEKFLSMIRSDIYAIGFCRLCDIYGSSTAGLPSDIAFLPVDRNGNNRLDNFEKIYDNKETILRGIWNGKYPRTLCGTIFAASASRPVSKNALEFLRWIISSGSQSLPSHGFSELAGTERESGLLALADNQTLAVQPARESVSYSWIIILLSFIVAAGVITAVIRTRRRKPSVASFGTIREIPAFNEELVTAPGGLYFDKSHTWAFMEKDGMVRVGIDDFLHHVTGSITGLILREPGEYVRRGEKLITIIRDGKQLCLHAPVSGIIRSQNTDLYLDSSIINSSPYTDGWLYLVEPKNWSKEIQLMLFADRFREWIRDEFIRLKDFIATSAGANFPAYAHITLQDGGELSDNLLEKLGPEVWDDFQTNFIDKSR